MNCIHFILSHSGTCQGSCGWPWQQCTSSIFSGKTSHTSSDSPLLHRNEQNRTQASQKQPVQVQQNTAVTITTISNSLMKSVPAGFGILATSAGTQRLPAETCRMQKQNFGTKPSIHVYADCSAYTTQRAAQSQIPLRCHKYSYRYAPGWGKRSFLTQQDPAKIFRLTFLACSYCMPACWRNNTCMQTGGARYTCTEGCMHVYLAPPGARSEWGLTYRN